MSTGLITRLRSYRFFSRLLGIQIVALLACATFFRFWKIGNIPGVNGDEAYLAFRSLRLLRGEFFHSTLDRSTYADVIQNVFYSIPLAALHLIFDPSIVLMRIVAVLSGLFALLLNYFLCRRTFDERTALFSTILLAVLPINIAYSRFGWEPSQSLAATLIVLYLALNAAQSKQHSLRWGVLCVVALIAAFIVHPTNIFIAPFIAVAALSRWKINFKKLLSPRISLMRKMIAGAGISLFGVIVVLILQSPPVRSRIALHAPSELPLFLLSLERLFSGATTYRYVAGSCVWSAHQMGSLEIELYWWDAVALLLVTIVSSTLWINRNHRNSSPADFILGTGWFVSVTFFFVVAGPQAISAPSERYGLWLIAPTTLLFTRGVMALLYQKPRWSFAVYGSSLVIAWSLLSGFYVNYFQFFQATGGMSHLTFHTGTIEPKLAALDYIKLHRQGNKQQYLIITDWWNYWPLLYLATNDKAITVLFEPEAGGLKKRKFLDRIIKKDDLWFVHFNSDSGLDKLQQELQANHFSVEEQTFLSYSQKPVITVFRPRPKPFAVLFLPSQ